MPLKIALISLNNVSRGYFPLGIAYLAGSLAGTGHEVKLYHMAFSFEKELIGRVNAFSPDIIGISFTSLHAKKAKEISAVLKKAGRVIVAGGPHATAMPADVLSEHSVDFAVLGEGETTFAELCEAVEKRRGIDSVAGIAYRGDSGRINFTAERPLIKDLDLLPRIPWEFMEVRRYVRGFMVNPSFGFKGVSIMASRGCPYSCVFCQPVLGKTARYRSVANIVEEMADLRQRYGLRGFNFCDDTLTINRDWVLGLCDRIKNSKELKGIVWSCNARVDTVNPQLLDRMADAGCRTIWYGVESGYQEGLLRMNKGTTVSQAVSACQWTKKSGIGLRVNIMIGFPWEDRAMIYRTVRFAKSLKPDQIQFGCVMPWPGTQLYRQFKSRIDYTKLIPMPTDHMGIEELARVRKDCLRRLYLDPPYIARSALHNIRSPWQFIGYIRRLKDKFFTNGGI